MPAAVVLFAVVTLLRVASQGTETVAPGDVAWRVGASCAVAPRADQGPWRAVSLGLGAELGLRDGVSLELDWQPGYVVWSAVDPAGAPVLPGDATRSGPRDAWAAVRLQLAGDPGLVLQHSRLRAVIAPGLVLPFPDPDWERERGRALDGKRYIREAPDRHAIGIGARLALEYELREAWGVRVRAGCVWFLPKESASIADPGTLNHTDYGNELLTAVAPYGALDMGRTILRAEGEVSGVFTPEILVNGGASVGDGFLLSVEPRLGIVLAARPKPVAVTFGYRIPVARRNADSEHRLSLALASASLPRGRP